MRKGDPPGLMEADGTVFYFPARLSLNPGDSLAAYGLEAFARKG